jgi:hypothetical protein
VNLTQCPACSSEPSHQRGTLVRLGSRCKAVLAVARAHGIADGAVLRDEAEMWLPVVDFEDHYEVSRRDGVRSIRTGRILRTPSKGDDYPRVEIDGRAYRVHILMAKAFFGPRPDGRVGALTHWQLSENWTVDPLRGLWSRVAEGGHRVPAVRQVQVCTARSPDGRDRAAAPATNKATRIRASPNGSRNAMLVSSRGCVRLKR